MKRLCCILHLLWIRAIDSVKLNSVATITWVVSSPQLFFSLKFNNGKIMRKKTDISFPEASWNHERVIMQYCISDIPPSPGGLQPTDRQRSKFLWDLRLVLFRDTRTKETIRLLFDICSESVVFTRIMPADLLFWRNYTLSACYRLLYNSALLAQAHGVLY